MKMKRRTKKNSIAFTKRERKRVLAIVLAILMVISAMDFSGMQYVSAADESKVDIIKAFTALSGEIANQQLAVDASESEINLPNSLSVTSEVYNVDTTQVVTGAAITVTGSAISVNPAYNLTGVTWEIDPGQSSIATFDSSVVNAYYTYVPVLPATDSEGISVRLADGVSLPQIRVQIEDGGKWAFSQSTTIDGVEITVKAEKDVFPEGAVLHAEKVTSAEDQEKIQSAISEEVQSVDTAKNVTKLVSFDITITDVDGNELQPDTSKGEVKVSFASLPIMTENTVPTQELKVFHMDDTLSEAKGLDTTVDQEAESVEATAEHFSVYTVAQLTDEIRANVEAEIKAADGTLTYYDTIQEAFAAAQGMSGSTLKLRANVRAGDLSVSSNPMVLDLNSFTLTCGKIEVGNAFTLTDTASGGKVLGNNDNGAIWLNGAQITISGGRIEATGAYASALRIFSGTAIIEGGSFHSQNAYGVMQQAGSVSISGGEFSTGLPAVRTGFRTNGGTAQISGGRFINGMDVSEGTLNDIISSGHTLKKQDESYILDLSQSAIKDDVSVVEASIAITGQPTGAELLEGYKAGAHSLTVTATAKPGVTISYTWNQDGTEISGANEATYALPAGLSAGTYVYHCKLSESGGYYVLSNKVTVKVYSSAVEITQQPTANQSTVVTGYTNPPTLTIGARLPAGLSGEFSYQWYQKSTSAAEDAKVGENQSSYQLPLSLPQGSYTYYCKLSYAASVVTSDPVTIAVADAVASMQKAGETNITYFTDLQDAFSSAPNNGSATISLLKDCTKDSDLVLYENREIIFDLGGHTLTFSNNNGYGIKSDTYNSCQLTLKNGNLVGNGYSVVRWNGTTLTVRNTTIKNQRADWSALIFNVEESFGYSGKSLWIEEGAVLEAQNSGTVTEGNPGVLSIQDGGEVHINGGTIRNTGSGVVVCASVSQNIHLGKAGVIQGGNGQVVGNVYFDEDDTAVTVYGGMEYHLLNEMVEGGKATVAYADSSKTAMYTKSYGKSGATVSVTIIPNAENAIGGLPEISYGASQTVSDVTKTSTEGYGIADQALTFAFTMPKGTPVFRVSVKQPNAISTVEGKNSKVYDGKGFSVSTDKGEFATWNGDGVATVEGYYTKTQAGDYIQTTVNGSGAAMTGGTPFNAGSYYVKLAVGEGSEHLSAVTYLPITITQAELAITGLAATNRPYDGTNTVALTGGVLSGICGTDDVTATMPTIGTATDGNVGNDKAVTVAKPPLSGTAAGNYTLADISSITVNITPVVPVVLWQQETQTVTYTGSAVSVTSPVVTLVNNETFSGNITCSYKTADAISYTDGLPTDAGTYLVKAHIEAAGNYVAVDSQDLTLTIEKATPTIIFKESYSDAITYTGTALVAPTQVDLTIMGASYSDVTFTWYRDSVKEANRLTGAPSALGTYVVVASIADTANTNATSASKTVTASLYSAEVVVVLYNNSIPGVWYTGDVSITAAGYTVSDRLDGTYAESYLLSGEDEVSKTLYFKQNGTGYITDGKTITVNIDKTGPAFSADTDGITISDNNWKKFLEQITFGHFFKENKDVSISATDSGSGENKYYYHIDTDSTTAKTAEELNSISFTEGSSFSITDENKYIIYAYAVDNAGNKSAYIRTDGIVIDKTAPTVTLMAPTGSDLGDVSGAAKVQMNETGIITYVIKTTEQSGMTAQNILDAADKKTVSVIDGQADTNLDVVFSGLTANNTYYMYAVGTDSAENNGSVVSTSFITTKSQPVFNENPTITGTYGQQVKDMTVSQVASTNSVAGSWSVSSTDKPSVGTLATYDVVFTPVNTAQYATVTVQVTPTVNPKNLTAAGVTIGEVTGSYTYDKTEKVPTVTVTDSAATITASDYEYSYSNNISAGTATAMVTVTAKGNYTGTVSHTFTIAKAAAPSITYPTASSITYGQKFSESTLTGGSTTYGTFKWKQSLVVPSAGMGKPVPVVFTPNTDTLKNYEATTTEVNISLDVLMATPTITVNATVSGASGNRTATLTASVTGVNTGECPTGAVKFVNSTDGSDVDISGANITSFEHNQVTITANFEWTGLTDQIYKVKAVYSGNGNYNTATSTEVEVDTRKQNQAALIIDSISTKTYGDSSFTLSATGGSGDEDVTFASSDPAIVSISGATATIHKAGTVTITATKAEDSTYNEATDSIALTVGKKELTVKADNKPNIIKGVTRPALTYAVTGLVGNDTFTGATLTTTATDTNTVGKYDITISGGTLANADNYTINYTGGKLTIINEPVSPGGSSDGGSSNGDGSSDGGGSSTATPQPDTGTPEIKDASNKAGWEAIKEQISQTRDGDTVTIEMKGSSVVSGEVLDAIRGTDTTLVFDMGDGITWSINGQSITDSSLNNVNLDVTLDTDAIPAELIRQMAGEQASSTLSLAYDGPFGFTSVLTINLNEINEGKYGNLFYYNPETKRLTLQAVGKIGEQGAVDFPFSHASDYVVIISEEPILEKTLDQIQISAVKGTLYVGGTEKKSMTLKLELPQLLKEAVEKDSSIRKVTYQSDNPKVATVTAFGEIIAKKAGKTTITTLVTINGVQRKFQTEITVRKAYIKLIKSKKTLKTGDIFTYKAIGYGVKTEDIMYYTSKKSVVVINKTTGKAKARTKGTDYVIAKAGKVKVQIKVKVS